jgi:hypothetical protein
LAGVIGARSEPEAWPAQHAFDYREKMELVAAAVAAAIR